MSAPAAANTLCSHCLLPVGRRAMRRTLDGEACAFCCYGCSIAYQVRAGRGEESEAAWLLIRLGVGAFLTMNIMLFSLVVYAGGFSGEDAALLPWVNLLEGALATPAMVILGGPFLRDAWEDGRRGRLNASVLIVAGAGAAYVHSVIALIEGTGDVYFDTAGMVLMLFTLGRYLEAAGRAKAARDLAPLLAAERALATVVVDGVEVRRPVRDILAGMLVRVTPGERIPVDGVVVDGRSNADEAVMTGESGQVAKAPGSAVIAGSINLDGPLLIESRVAGNATRWARICRSVRDSLMRRSPAQRLADAVVAVFVPLVLALGIATVAYWARHLPFDRALLTGLAVLVVACPCAVGLAAPMATSLGIGRLARHGVIVRDPAALEALAAARAFAFDKTGTLTAGRPRLVAIHSDDDAVLARAAGLERHSEHGLGRTLVAEAAARGLVPIAATDIRAVPGRGLVGMAAGERVAAGSAALMGELGFACPPTLAACAAERDVSGHTVVQVGWAGRVHGVFAFDDTPLPEARDTVAALRHRGASVALLTGDRPAAALRIAALIGIAPGAVEAALQPEDKRAALARWRAAAGVTAMVGDGLNDAPVLAAADVGIAVGSGTDLARETAAIVLPPGGLWMLPWVVDVARAVRRVTLSNLAWAFGYNFLAVGLAMAGLLQPVAAAAVMAGSSFLVIVNSLRLERLADPEAVPVVAPHLRPHPEERGEAARLEGRGRPVRAST